MLFCEERNRFCREVGIPQTSTRTKPSQDAWLSLPALDSASESPFFCWWWVRHPWSSAPWADCSCQFWPFLDHFLAPRLVVHAFVKASKTFFPVFSFFWMGVPLVAPRALVHWPSWQLCEHIHWEHHCGTETLCWPVVFHGNPLTMVHRILAMRALVENAFPAKSAAKCGSKSKTALGTWNSSAKTPWARRSSCGSAKRLCPHSQILWLGRMQVNMSHAYSGDRRRLVLESMVTVEKSIFRSWQIFFTFSSWHWNESLTGGSHVGRPSSKTSPRVKRLGPFNLCIVIFMSRGYCVSCAPVQLDPHTRSRRCGISRWQLSTLVCSNVWPISLKSSCGRGSKKYHGLCSKDDWIMGNRRNPPWWNTNKLHSYGFLDILSIGGAS